MCMKSKIHPGQRAARKPRIAVNDVLRHKTLLIRLAFKLVCIQVWTDQSTSTYEDILDGPRADSLAFESKGHGGRGSPVFSLAVSGMRAEGNRRDATDFRTLRTYSTIRLPYAQPHTNPASQPGRSMPELIFSVTLRGSRMTDVTRQRHQQPLRTSGMTHAICDTAHRGSYYHVLPGRAKDTLVQPLSRGN